MIRCDCHDHFEIACMHKSAVNARTKNGKLISGIAQDIVTLSKQEYLRLKTETGDIELALSDIVELEYEDQLIQVS